MATQYQMSYTSRLARHRHIMWTDDQYASTQVSIPDYEKARVLNMRVSSFNQNMAALKYGRFYPAQILKTSVKLPEGFFRVKGIEGGEFTADFNHPLAGKDFRVEKATRQSGSPPVGAPSMLLEWAGSVLDLMSSWRSHLPSQTGAVTGLGMNAEEMSDNPQLQSYIIHDLNRCPQLPFHKGHFDVVVNTVSIEYLSEPRKVLSEVRRVLKPGGLIIVTFSNRYFPPKTTMFWTQLHPAERLGWALQLLQKAGFSALHCQVERGLRHAQDDRYAGQVEEMVPLFAAWGKADMI